MKYFLAGTTLLAISVFSKYLRDLVRAVRYHQWKAKRDKLTLEQYVQSLESEYYKAKMKEIYNDHSP